MYKKIVFVFFLFITLIKLQAQNVCIEHSVNSTNVLYLGIANDFKVCIDSISCNFISLESDDLDIHNLSECKYLIFPKKTGKALLKVNIKNLNTASKTINYLFNVEDIPKPKILVGEFDNKDSISINKLVNIKGITAKVPFDIPLILNYYGYKIMYISSDGNTKIIFKSNKQYFTSDFIEYIKTKGNKGDRLLFYDIVCDVHSTAIFCNPIEFVIK